MAASRTNYNHRVMGALQHIIKTEEDVRNEIQSAEIRVKELEEEYNLAVADLTILEAERKAVLEGLAADRSLLASCFISGKKPDSDEEKIRQLLMRHEQIAAEAAAVAAAPALPQEQPNLSEIAARPTSVASTSRKSIAVAATGIKPDKPRVGSAANGITSLDDVTHFNYLEACPAIIFDADNDQWIEVRCPDCGRNADEARRLLFKGGLGILRHMSRHHDKVVKASELLTTCQRRVVDIEEVQKIIAGGEEAKACIDAVLEQTSAGLLPSVPSAEPATAPYRKSIAVIYDSDDDEDYLPIRDVKRRKTGTPRSSGYAPGKQPVLGRKSLSASKKDGASMYEVATQYATQYSATKAFEASGLISLDQKPTHHDYLEYCPTIIYDGNTDEWVEVRCPTCGTNISLNAGALLKGPVGMTKHISRLHGGLGIKGAGISTICKYRTVPEEEVEAIIAGGEKGMPYVKAVGANKKD